MARKKTLSNSLDTNIIEQMKLYPPLFPFSEDMVVSCVETWPGEVEYDARQWEVLTEAGNAYLVSILFRNSGITQDFTVDVEEI